MSEGFRESSRSAPQPKAYRSTTIGSGKSPLKQVRIPLKQVKMRLTSNQRRRQEFVHVRFFRSGPMEILQPIMHRTRSRIVLTFPFSGARLVLSHRSHWHTKVHRFIQVRQRRKQTSIRYKFPKVPGHWPIHVEHMYDQCLTQIP